MSLKLKMGAMGLSSYVIRIVRLSLSQSFGRADTISAFATAILYGLGKLLKLDAIVNLNLWWLPLIILGVIFALRLLLAPYWIYKDKVNENADLLQQKLSLEKKLGEAEQR